MVPSVRNLLAAIDHLDWRAASEFERWLASFAIVSLGVLSLFAHATFTLRTTPSLTAFLLGPAIPLLLSIVILTTVAWLLTSEYSQFLPRIALWCISGAVVLVAIGQLIVLYQRAVGVTSLSSLFTVAYMVTIGTAMGLVIGIYDAGLRQTKQELDAQRERAERYAQQLSVLNRILRHDIRTGVQVIRGYAEMLPNPNDVSPAVPVERIQERANEMHETAESASEIRRMLEDSDRWIDQMDVEAVLESAVEATTERHPDARIRTTIPSETPVTASTMLELAFEELLTNAIEHNDSTPCTVEVECEVHKESVVVQIADNGPGIPDEELEPLMEGEETSLTHASGIGLWLATWIVEGSGGSLAFDENECGGSTVTVRLPK